MIQFKISKQFSLLLDGLIIILQVTYGMSLLKVWLLDPFHVPYYLDITLLTFLIYLFRFGGKFKLYKSKGYFLPKLLLIIYAFDVLQGLFMSSTTFAFSRAIFMMNVYLFIEYLISLVYEKRYDDNNVIDRLSKPYEIYSQYNIVCIFLCALFIISGLLSSTNNPMPENSLFSGNMSTGQIYYFPGYLSVALNSFRILAYLDIPILTGLSHEPHVIWWIIGPCLFLFLRRYNEKKTALAIIIIVSLILSLLATSFTALLVFLTTMLLEILYSTLIGKNKKSFLVIFLIIAIFLVIILQRNDFLMDAFSSLADDKLNDNSGESSMDYSVSSLSYMFSPGSILGWGNVTDIGWGFKLKGVKISFVTFILDIILFISLYIKIFKLYLSKNIQIHYLGMACIYFSLHSLKMGAQVFTFPYFTYIIVLISVVDRLNKTYK